jgi:photosystem II stability/assembly factor-like uncharacterized protein
MKYTSLRLLSFLILCVSCGLPSINTITSSSTSLYKLTVTTSSISAPQPTISQLPTKKPFITKNKYTTWKEFGLQGYKIHSIGINPNNSGEIMAATDMGLFKINDKMDGWDHLSIEECGPYGLIPKIKFDPTHSNIVYAIMNNKLCQSVDSGVTWKHVYETTDEYPLQVLWFSPFQYTLYTGRAGELVRSENQGKSWQRLFWGKKFQTESSALTFLISLQPSAYFWSDGHLYFSSDGISNWEIRNITNLPPLRNIVIDVLNSPTTLYATTEIGVYKSIDGGLNWNAMNNGLKDINILSIYLDYEHSNILYLGTEKDGVYKTINGGIFWYQFTDGLSSLVVNELFSHPTRNLLYAGTENGIFVITMGG